MMQDNPFSHLGGGQTSTPRAGGDPIVAPAPPAERRAEEDQALERERFRQQQIQQANQLGISQQNAATSSANSATTREARTFRPMSPNEAKQAGLPEGGTYQVNNLGEIKTITAAPKPASSKPQKSPEEIANQRARIAEALDNITQLESMVKGSDFATGSIVGQESWRRGDDYGGIPAMFGMNQTANDVFGASEMVIGDLINQVRIEMAESGTPLGVKGADTPVEAARIAASIAPINQTQDEERFLVGLERARRYYNRRLASLDGTLEGAAYDDLDDEEEPTAAPAEKYGLDELIGGRQNGGYGSTEDGSPLIVVRDGKLFGATKGVLADGKRHYTEIGGTTVGLDGEPFDNNEILSSEALKLYQDIKFREEISGKPKASDLAKSGITLGLLDEASGVGEVIGKALTGDFNVADNFQRGQATELYRRDQAREATGGAGVAAELLGAGGAVRALGGVTTGLKAARGVQVAGQPVTRKSIQNALTKRSAAEGAGIGALAGAAEGDSLQERGTNALLGASLGGALGAGGQAIGNRVANKTRNALSSPPRVVEGALDIISEGEKRGVPVMTTDVAPPQSAMGRYAKQTLPEKIPLAGMAGPRGMQQDARKRAVETFVDEAGGNARRDLYDIDDGFVEQVSKLLTDQRSAKLTRLTNAKKSVIDGIDTPFVAAPETVKAISQQIRQLKEIDEKEFEPVIQRLQRFGEALTSGKRLSVIEEQRKLLGNMFADNNLASIKDRGSKAVNAIYRPLVDDMAGFIETQSGKAAKAKWARANKELSAMAGELKSTAFKRVLRDSETTPESVGRILFNNPDNVSDMRRLVGGLNEEGKSKVRAALIQRAFDRAGGSEGVSVERFLNNLSRDGKKIGVAFEGKDREALEGLRRLLEATRRAGAASAEVRTGEQNLPTLMGIGATGTLGVAGGVTTLGIGGLLARIYEKPAIRNRLIGLARTKSGSMQEREIVLTINKLSAPTVQGWRAAASNDNSASALAAQEREGGD